MTIALPANQQRSADEDGGDGDAESSGECVSCGTQMK